ncbi:MAG TPA: class II aldolase/adducin family protein [Kofleriaceae bacterium]|nr:class II aldolase/adducin family protein [Kofleriaceae bacterium]
MSASLRTQLAQYAQELHVRGWVANHDGNLTVRDGARWLATPTATSKRKVTERGVLELDTAGKVVGAGKVFGEIGLHLAVYHRRPDVGAVIHAHPPYATAIACARGGAADHPIARPFIAEAFVSLGPIVPRTTPAPPGEPAVAALAPWCEDVDAVLLGGHGVMAWGADLEQALLRLELVEHLARIAITAAPIGGVEPLPEAWVPALLAARAKAGIGKAADRAVQFAPKAVIACAPAPHSPVPTIAPVRSSSSGAAGDGADLASIVREEIVRALRAK